MNEIFAYIVIDDNDDDGLTVDEIYLYCLFNLFVYLCIKEKTHVILCDFK